MFSSHRIERSETIQKRGCHAWRAVYIHRELADRTTGIKKYKHTNVQSPRLGLKVIQDLQIYRTFQS